MWFDAEGRDPQWEPVTVPEIKNGSFCFHAETEHFVTCHIQVRRISFSTHLGGQKK